MRDVVFDGGDECGDAAKGTAAESIRRQVTEEAFDHVEPRCRSGREVDMKAPMGSEPLLDCGMLVRGVVVTD